MKPAFPNHVFRSGGEATRSILIVALSFGTLLTGCKRDIGDADPTSGAKPGEQRVFGIGHGVHLAFRWVPAGEFVMGSPPDETGRVDDEDQKNVRVGSGFWIAEHETTVDTWQQIMGIQPPRMNRMEQKPIAGVSWFDCRDFLGRLNSPVPGWKFELPYEWQWEYACRAGSNSAYARPPAETGWIYTNAEGHSHAVGLKTPNAWSIHDMHGNVAEWCRDRMGDDWKHAAIRGGSWASDFSSRAAARNSDTPFLRSSRVGFRMILVRDKTNREQRAPAVCKNTPRQLP